MRNQVVLFGSFVVDLMARTPRLPTPGETVRGSVFQCGPGGKGFNQGVAAHKAGAGVVMAIKLGRDAFADIALNAMNELGMDRTFVFFSEDVETGVALISVDEQSGQNEIVVVPGASGAITEKDTRSLEKTIEGSAYLLTQLETNLDAIERVVDHAYRNRVKVILNTAPVQNVSAGLLSKAYIITPNEIEAEALTNVKIAGEKDAAIAAAAEFHAKGVQNVIITLGKEGAFVSDGKRAGIIPSPNVKAVDTTGAGDAFNGGLVAALLEGKDLWAAVRFANTLAALSVQRIGTTPAMPTRKEVDDYIRTMAKADHPNG
jgi:ribokinase